MDTQESVIVIIKKGTFILLQKNERWHDISFIGGKSEPEDEQLPINTAYREVEEELFLKRDTDFSLELLKPKIITFEKFSKRTSTYRNYKIVPFFLKVLQDLGNRLDAPNNLWLDIKEINSYSDELFPLSDIVKRVIPELELDHIDSYRY